MVMNDLLTRQDFKKRKSNDLGTEDLSLRRMSSTDDVSLRRMSSIDEVEKMEISNSNSQMDLT